MPVLRFPVEMLLKATGMSSVEEIRDALFRLKCETDILDTGEIEVEVNPDRPDMYSLEGIARAVRGITRLERSWQQPETRPSGLKLIVDNVPSRPYVVAAVVWNVNISGEDDLRQLIQFQEKLHDTIGRRRRKAAIGFHDLDKLPSRIIKYTSMPVETTKFVPLGSAEPISAARVLEETEQGRIYGRISLRGGEHPFLVAGSEIIAMPPVINSEITRLGPRTRNLFIDVTGTDFNTVKKVLDIIVSNLSERGAIIGTVEVDAPYMKGETPLLEWKRVEISQDSISRILGYEVTPSEAARLLEYMRHRASEIRGHRLVVDVPPFRADVIGEIDLVEDIAMAVGYDSLGPLYERPVMRGSLLDSTLLSRAVRRLSIGLGFTEVASLTLTSPRLLEALGISGVRVENPVQLEYSVLRPSLAPGLIAVARENQHAEKPVKVFEIGSVVTEESGTIREEERLGMMLMDSEVSIEMLQAPLYAALRALGAQPLARAGCALPYMIEGRCASLYLGGEYLGYVGEVSPEVLERLGIEYPVALAEVRLGVLLAWKSKTRSREWGYP
ncbi:MAG: phenylalanine--tRNA ligase subunit beta [Desulfurococcales archaeon]|nr:phenylalanine--tRNA ligase subunit beta [Desulfurococcales archaeon]